jgi:hypothetical protein
MIFAASRSSRALLKFPYGYHLTTFSKETSVKYQKFLTVLYGRTRQTHQGDVEVNVIIFIVVPWVGVDFG